MILDRDFLARHPVHCFGGRRELQRQTGNENGQHCRNAEMANVLADAARSLPLELLTKRAL